MVSQVSNHRSPRRHRHRGKETGRPVITQRGRCPLCTQTSWRRHRRLHEQFPTSTPNLDEIDIPSASEIQTCDTSRRVLSPLNFPKSNNLHTKKPESSVLFQDLERTACPPLFSTHFPVAELKICPVLHRIQRP